MTPSSGVLRHCTHMVTVHTVKHTRAHYLTLLVSLVKPGFLSLLSVFQVPPCSFCRIADETEWMVTSEKCPFCKITKGVKVVALKGNSSRRK